MTERMDATTASSDSPSHSATTSTRSIVAISTLSAAGTDPRAAESTVGIGPVNAAPTNTVILPAVTCGSTTSAAHGTSVCRDAANNGSSVATAPSSNSTVGVATEVDEVEEKTCRDYIEEHFLLMRCPQCHTPCFPDFAASLALSCPSCDAFFCGWCLSIYPDSLEAHNCACFTAPGSPTPMWASTPEQQEAFRIHRLRLRRSEVEAHFAKFSPEVSRRVAKNLQLPHPL